MLKTPCTSRNTLTDSIYSLLLDLSKYHYEVLLGSIRIIPTFRRKTGQIVGSLLGIGFFFTLGKFKCSAQGTLPIIVNSLIT